MREYVFIFVYIDGFIKKSLVHWRQEMDDKFRLNIPRYSLLTDEKKELIHLSTLEVLRKTGIAVKDEKTIQIYYDAGCTVERDIVKMPHSLVEWALRNTSTRIPIRYREGNAAMYIEYDNEYFGTGSDTLNVIDIYTGERRKAVLQDVGNASKLVDALSEINSNMSAALASDVNPAILDIYHFNEMVNNSKKSIVFTTWVLENLKTIIEMTEIVTGGMEKLKNNSFFILSAEPISPLTISKETAQELMYMAEMSLPVIFTTAILTGATGPVTIAGGIVQVNAEILGGYVLDKLINRHISFLYGECALPMDVRTSEAPYITPEYMLANTKFADMARYYKLPMFSIARCSDSTILDAWSTLEVALWIMLISLYGGNLIHDIGYIEDGLATSLELIVIFDEIIGMMRHFTRGFEINYDTITQDVIDSIGTGGEYLSSEHTLKHFKEKFYSYLFTKTTYDAWKKESGKDLIQRANDRVKDILKNNNPEPLDEKIKDELSKIIKYRDK